MESDLSLMCELPSGMYYIGDPTLVLNRELDIDKQSPALYERDHYMYAFDYTGFVEGRYKDAKHEVTYTIESGILGMFPSAFCDIELVKLYGCSSYFSDPIMFYSSGKGYFEILSTNYSYIIDTRMEDLDVLKASEEDYDY